MMPNKLTVQIVAIVVALVFVFASWITQGEPNTGFLKYFSIAVLAVTLLLTAWDKYLWKLPMIQRIPNVPANIDGTWSAKLASDWKDPETEQPVVKTVYLVIRQTSGAASAQLISDESVSESSLARVVRENGIWKLHYIYSNLPERSIRGRSPFHYGSSVLDINGKPAKRLTGEYWTSRNTGGTLKLSRKSRKHVGDFEEAVRLFEDLTGA